MKTYQSLWTFLCFLGAPAVSFAVCTESNSSLQRLCEQREQAQEQAQERAQQRAQQQEQQRAQEAQQREQQEAQQRAQQQEQQRTQEAQQREQQEAQQRAQQQEQQRTQEAQQREQQETQQRQQQEAQQRTQQPRPQQQQRAAASGTGALQRGTTTGRGTTGEPAQRPSYSTAASAATQSVRPGSMRRINAQRATLQGVNRRPVPSGRVQTDARGRSTIATPDGRRYDLRANGSVAAFRGGGRSANFYANGRVRSVHTATVDVVRTGRGARIVTVRRPDHTLLVSYGPHAGYVQRALVYRGRPYMQRTYLLGGRVIVRNYARYSYGGFAYYAYVPQYAFAPAYYGWLAAPWGLPIAYAWPWTNAAWYAYNGGYFVPYPAYPSPAAWMTDYYLAAVLQANYAAQLGAPPQSVPDHAAATGGDGAVDDAYAGAPDPLTPDIKAQITSEVGDQLASDAAAAQGDQAAASGELPLVLQPNHIFVVDQPINAVTDQEQSCSLSAGDALQLITPPSAGIPTAQLQVAASHEADCPAMSEVTLTLDDLQEMYNSFRAQIDAAAQALAASKAAGLPRRPEANPSALPGPASDSTDVGSVLAQAQAEGDQTETAVTDAAFSQ